MALSITADYMTSEGCPEPYLRRIADAGFSHVHWAYHWNTDFIYSRCEVDRIEVMYDKTFSDLEAVKDRLISIHLHDNDGLSDQHKPLFSGTVDWKKLAAVIARSSYNRCVSMELMTDNAEYDSEEAFLENAYKDGLRFTKLLESEREKIG